MKLSESVKPITYLKTHASEIIRDMSRDKQAMIITQNGEAKAVLQGICQYEETQESLALLKVLAISSENLRSGKTAPVKETFRRLKDRIAGYHEE